MKQSIVLLSLLTAGLLGASCVKVDNSLGKGLVDKNIDCVYGKYNGD